MKRLGEKSAEQIALISERSDQAVQNLQTVSQLERDLGDIEDSALSTGAFADFRLGVANIAATLGAEGEFVNKLAAAEDFAGLSTKLQFAETQILKVAISEKEQELAGRINTKMNKSGLGNRFAIKRMKALAHGQLLHDDIVGQIRDENPDMPLDSVLRKSKSQMSRLPYVSEKWVDERGVPQFFPSFATQMKIGTPDITLEEMVDAWKLKEAEFAAR